MFQLLTAILEGQDPPETGPVVVGPGGTVWLPVRLRISTSSAYFTSRDARRVAAALVEEADAADAHRPAALRCEEHPPDELGRR